MRRFLLSVFCLSAVVAALVAWTERTRIGLVEARAAFPPHRVPLAHAAPPILGRAFVRSAIGTVETGAVRLGDGHEVWWWFRSAHENGDPVGTLFQFTDGSDIFVEGYFCCGVEFPEGSALRDRASLLRFLAEIDGSGS